jgi:hypothetical protein
MFIDVGGNRVGHGADRSDNGGRRGACGQSDRNTRFSGFRVTEFRLARVASAEISASRLTANSGRHRWRYAIVSIIATVLLPNYTNRGISEEVGSPECDGSGER